MIDYIDLIMPEYEAWKALMKKKPSILSKASKGIQNKFNSVLPDKYHEIMDITIKNLVKGILIGSEYLNKKPISNMPLKIREELFKSKLEIYRKTAIVEGASTGAGGLFMGFADFPLLLTIKIKFLFEAASIYGFDVNDYKERLYILYIFQLAFSSQGKTNKVFQELENWNNIALQLPDDINDFNWHDFQQEYRDYIDIAKMLQLVPLIGAFVGAYANSKLLDKLGETAMNSYRMRLINQ